MKFLIIRQVLPDVMLQTCVQKVCGSCLGQDISYSEYVFRGFPQSLQANSGNSALIGPQPPPSKSFPVHDSLNNLQKEGYSMLISEMFISMLNHFVSLRIF
jgi:hypothetical protein